MNGSTFGDSLTGKAGDVLSGSDGTLAGLDLTVLGANGRATADGGADTGSCDSESTTSCE